MSTEILIYSHSQLDDSRGRLESDLDDLLGEAGGVTGGGSGMSGWNIDIELESDAERELIVRSIAVLLRDYPVPRDTYLKVIAPGRADERVDVFPQTT